MAKALKLASNCILERDIETLRVLTISKISLYSIQLLVNNPANYGLVRDTFSMMLTVCVKSNRKKNIKTAKFKQAKDRYSFEDVARIFDYPVFGNDDWLSYRAVMNFYLKDYNAALNVNLIYLPN